MPGRQQFAPKPFAGKVFYLDLPSNRRAEALESDIKLLGGIVEKFFSKEIRYLVSNKREAKYVKCFRRELATPSPDSGQTERIKAPFIKVEDASSVERGPSRAKMNPDKKLVGFCECCMVQYDNLIKHVQSVRHLAFAKGNDYLAKVQRILNLGSSRTLWDSTSQAQRHFCNPEKTDALQHFDSCWWQTTNESPMANGETALPRPSSLGSDRNALSSLRDASRFSGQEDTVPLRLVASRRNHSQVTHDELTTRIKASGPGTAQVNHVAQASFQVDAFGRKFILDVELNQSVSPCATGEQSLPDGAEIARCVVEKHFSGSQGHTLGLP
ncbi:hypothetical protein NHX12_001131 [Muraenolepis orangiensis]|uniref:Protein DBF4 homolog A n=1 Tax=Muraenolepis orangiensis TaxID=630683 RepID=A0A9Q0E0B5_9TELE|nr:hypothetical protein NHX12_001131 [Muraenolepis orangiensis]